MVAYSCKLHNCNKQQESCVLLWFEGKLLARRIRLLLHSAKLNIILLVQLR
jgi:hypothetical protein